MARVDYLSAEDLDPDRRHLLGRPINLFRALANSPDGLEQFYRIGEWIRWQCGLDPRLRELAILQVGRLAHSEYEFSHHVEISRRFGVTDADIDALNGSGHLDDPAELVIRAATQITDDGDLDDSTWARLRETLGPAGAVDLVLVVAHYNAVVRVLRSLRVDVEPEYQGYLKEFPLDQD